MMLGVLVVMSKRHNYVEDHLIVIWTIEVNNSSAGGPAKEYFTSMVQIIRMKKANQQLLLYANLLDEYACIAWNGKEDKADVVLRFKTISERIDFSLGYGFESQDSFI